MCITDTHLTTSESKSQADLYNLTIVLMTYMHVLVKRNTNFVAKKINIVLIFASL